MTEKEPTMLYQPGTQYTSEGVSYNTIVVDKSEVEGKLKDGWYEHFSKFPKKPGPKPK